MPKDIRAYGLGRKYPELAPVIERLDGRVSALEAGVSTPDYTLAKPDFSIAPAAAVVPVSFRLKDTLGTRLRAEVVVDAYVSTTERDLWAPLDAAGGWSATKGRVIDYPVVLAWWRILTNSDGEAELALDNAGTAGVYYLNVLWYGRLYSSPAITFT